MVFKQFKDLQLSALGFGAMRLPLLADGSGSIDQEELDRMVDAADCIACGQCREVCPQKINVPAEMAKLVEEVKSRKSWEEVCRERETINEKKPGK